MSGLLRLVTNQEIEDEEALSREGSMRPADIATGLAATIRKHWQINRANKQDIEQRLLRDFELRNNKYDSKTLAEINQMGGSDVFMPLTSMQCNAAAAWIKDIVLPTTGQKSWSIEKTPIADIPEQFFSAMQDNFRQQAQQQGMPQEAADEQAKATKDSMQESMQKEAEKAARKMTDLIEDQLLDSNWSDALDEFVDDIVTFPTAFMKTTYQTQINVSYKDGQSVVEEKLVEKDERVSPFDMFPSPNQTNIKNGNLMERLHFTRAELFECIGKLGYKEESIRDVLNSFDSLDDWSTQSDTMRDKLEGNSLNTESDSIDGVRFFGYVKASEVLDWGVDESLIDDKDKDIEIDAILIGNHVIRAVPNLDPQGKRPYYMASYRNTPSSFWGKSIPELLEPHQRFCNNTARSLSNNISMASAPMAAVYIDRLPKGSNLTGMHPWKVFQLVSDPSGNNVKPIEFFQPKSNANELMSVFQYFWDQAGDVTGVWKANYGADQTRMAAGAQTASGMAMMYENASRQIKSVIAHIDKGVTRPRIESQYHTNMMYADDDSVKGDMRVNAIGASALIMKAAKQQRANEFLAVTNNPLDAQIIGTEGRAKLLQDVAHAMDFDDIVPDADELKRRQQAQAQQPPEKDPKLQIEQLRYDARLEDQKLEMQNADAERQTRLHLAQMQQQSEMYELAQKYDMTMQQLEAKLKEIALKERNTNARFTAEKQIKERHGSGI